MRSHLTKLFLVLAISALKSLALPSPEQDVESSRTPHTLILSTSSEGVSEIDTNSNPSSAATDKSSASSDKYKKKGETQTPRQVKMLLSKGKEYFGFVVGKDMHGRGTLQYADGTIYEGDFAHNKRHGRGRISYASGEQYQGEWFKGFMTGRGVYNFQDGSVYEVSMSVFVYLIVLM